MNSQAIDSQINSESADIINIIDECSIYYKHSLYILAAILNWLDRTNDKIENDKFSVYNALRSKASNTIAAIYDQGRNPEKCVSRAKEKRLKPFFFMSSCRKSFLLSTSTLKIEESQTTLDPALGAPIFEESVNRLNEAFCSVRQTEAWRENLFSAAILQVELWKSMLSLSQERKRISTDSENYIGIARK